MAKYASAPIEKGPGIGDYLRWEGDPVYTRDTIKLTTAAELPVGTILEEVSEEWVKASAGTGRLGLLVHDVPAADGEQEAVIVTRMACFSSENMLIESGIKTTAIGTLTTQGIKVI